MIDIVKQIINFYYKNFRAPKLEELNIEDENLLNRKGSIFVTLYLDGVIIGSKGNIKEIKQNIVEELIENTIGALEDDRFTKPSLKDKDRIKIRIDEIISRGKPLPDGTIKNIDPVKYGVFVVKSDYEKAGVILPNISGNLITGEDFLEVLSNKLKEDFDDKNYLVYKIETKVYSDL